MDTDVYYIWKEAGISFNYCATFVSELFTKLLISILSMATQLVHFSLVESLCEVLLLHKSMNYADKC